MWIVPQGRRKGRAQYDVDSHTRQADVVRDWLGRINPYLLERVLQLVHPAKDRFDATRDPGSILD